MSAAVPAFPKYECPTLGVWNQLFCPAGGFKVLWTMVWPLKPGTTKFVPWPRTPNRSDTWPKPGIRSLLLNRSYARFTGSLVASEVKDGPVITSWLIWTPDETISTGQLENTKLAASASTRKSCSLPDGNQPAPDTRR